MIPEQAEVVFSTVERLLLAAVIVASIAVFVIYMKKKLALVAKGEPTSRTDRPKDRAWRFVRDVLFQYKVIEGRPGPGLLHALIFWGFCAFLIEKAYHLPHLFGLHLPAIDSFYQAVLSPVLFCVSVLVLVGVVGLAIRRGILKPPTLTYNYDAWLVLGLIGTIMVTFLLQFTSAKPTGLIHGAVWVHNLAIFAFLVYIPVSKHLHLLFCPVGEYVRNFEIGRLRKLDLEDEEKEDFGVNTLQQLNWKDLLDTFACIQCGRCNDACPAKNTGKDLSPREAILDMQHGLMDEKFEEQIVGGIVGEKIIWQCTTCGGCEFHCPVGIEHVPKFLGLRRYRIAEGEFPTEAQNTFKGLERSGNPWNYGTHLREETLEEIGAPVFEKGTEWLLWMGCFANYDQAYRRSMKALIKVLKHAGVSFGVLPAETCCGDPARRLGNEMLFQMGIEENIEAFKELGVTKVFTACPHCMQTIGNDYKDFGCDLEVIHHTRLLQLLIEQGKLKAPGGATERVVYHDPCYLSRYNKVVAGPRSVLGAFGFQVDEVERSGERSFCCGGGGGAIFLEESQGERINHNRTDELLAKGTDKVCVSCPFCFTMIKDGVGDKGKGDDVRVEDIVELIAAKLPEATADTAAGAGAAAS